MNRHKQLHTISKAICGLPEPTSTAKTTGILFNDTIDVNDVVDPQKDSQNS